MSDTCSSSSSEESVTSSEVRYKTQLLEKSRDQLVAHAKRRKLSSYGTKGTLASRIAADKAKNGGEDTDNASRRVATSLPEAPTPGQLKSMLSSIIDSASDGPPQAKKTLNDTRLSSAFGCYLHIAKRFKLLQGFVASEVEKTGSASCKSLLELKDLLQLPDMQEKIASVAHRLLPVIETMDRIADPVRKPIAADIAGQMGLSSKLEPAARETFLARWRTHPNFPFWEAMRCLDPVFQSAMQAGFAYATAYLCKTCLRGNGCPTRP
eukprot:TRINITY_DN1082_c0_g1_i1.p1 TRINITY_DN1082_c0_g1~~TRINITY_DN1082_c0_g1_i1.p1  ORF type:complete len:266 (+),score=31.43 TRINITY_DN1082_c0_g1_i1:123-920(+)